MFRKRFSKIRQVGLGFLLAVGIGASALAFASDDPELPKSWPERVLRSLHTGLDHGFVELSSALFNNLDTLNQGLFKFPGHGKAALEVHRDVVDNFDLLSTYTVIDRVRIKAAANPFQSLTTWTEDHATTGIGTPYIGLIFNPQASIEWTDVRPVKALDYKKEPSSKDLAVQAKAFNPEPSPLPMPSPDPDVSSLNPDVPLTFLDPSIRARFSKVLNIITFPFRLPLHRADVSHMKDGEILGYAFDGQLEVGVSAGLKVIPTLNVIHAGINLAATVVLHGRYQISVLREDAQYARVKLTHLSEKGVKASVNIGIDRKDAFDGVILFKGSAVEIDHVGKIDANFIPFNFDTSHIKTNQFDVVYRYDLNSDAGKKAYHKAVLGKFVESEEVTGGITGPTGKPVEKMLSRESDRTADASNIRIDLLNILRLDWNAKKESLEATLELPDGTHHVLEAFREKKRQRHSFFGATSENRTRRMTLYLDAELLTQKDPQSIFVITEVTEEDSNTKAHELNAAINRMETLLRKPDILPSVAEKIPGRKEVTSERKAYYGRSSFYYGYSLNYEEIVAFLSVDYATVEAIARKYLEEDEANRFLEVYANAAKAMANEASPAKELFEAIRGVFANKFAIEPLTNIVFDTLKGTLIDYFVTAQNVAFGKIQERGKTITSVERALTNTDKELGFETYAQRLKQDSEAIVKDLHTDANSDGTKNIHFNLALAPENVFFRLFRVTGYKKQKLVAEVVVNNRSKRFVAGDNILNMNPNSPDLLISKLSRDLRKGEFYNLSVAYSQKTDFYGPVSSSRFEVEEPYPAP
jgi:hypothetical protein